MTQALRLSVVTRLLLTGCLLVGNRLDAGEAIEPSVRLDHESAGDQDDLCFWRDADDPLRSLVITSDKKAGQIAVYDLKGELQQLVKLPKPGNIDIRQEVECGGKIRDIIAVNQRTDGWKLAVFEMNRSTRQLERLDRNDLTTGPNYGVCLYHSRKDGTLYAVITSEEGTMEQYALSRTEEPLSMKKVRNWKIGKAEGAVADDELGKLYITEEEGGVWELEAEPTGDTPGKLVIRLGEHGLKADLEGITVVKHGTDEGLLIVSSQGQNRFFVYERTGAHRFLGSFSVTGAEETDGIDIFPVPLGEEFPQGLFGCHTAATIRPSVLLTSWSQIAKQFVTAP